MLEKSESIAEVSRCDGWRLCWGLSKPLSSSFNRGCADWLDELDILRCALHDGIVRRRLCGHEDCGMRAEVDGRSKSSPSEREAIAMGRML